MYELDDKPVANVGIDNAPGAVAMSALCGSPALRAALAKRIPTNSGATNSHIADADITRSFGSAITAPHFKCRMPAIAVLDGGAVNPFFIAVDVPAGMAGHLFQ
jgi:hypothetical protein